MTADLKGAGRASSAAVETNASYFMINQTPKRYPANTKNKAVPSTIGAPAVMNGTGPLAAAHGA